MIQTSRKESNSPRQNRGSQMKRKNSMEDSIAERIDRLSPNKRALIALQVERKRRDHLLRHEIIRHRGAESYPLSFAQEALWFLHHLAPESPFYNEYLMTEITGQLNVAALEECLKEHVRRHETLRTTFTSSGGQILQVISSPKSFYLPIVDLRYLPTLAVDQHAMELARQEVRRPFDLSQGSMPRVSLLWLSDERYLLLIATHHLLADHWSISVFFRELSEIYDAFSRGSASTLSELQLQYGDFALWQRESFQGELLDVQLSYWKEQLAG